MVTKTRDYFSYSAMSTYRSCPLKYYFRYILGLPELITNDNLQFGSGIHRALESVYRAQLEGDSSPTIDALVEEFSIEWQVRQDVDSELNNSGPSATVLDQARNMLTAFMSCELPFNGQPVLGIEEEIRGPIDPEVPDLFGRLDLLTGDHTENTASLIDFKTSKCKWNEGDLLRAADQLILSRVVVKQQLGIEDIRLFFVVLTKTKVPSISVFEVPVTDVATQRTQRVFKTVWQSITAGNFYPAPSAMNCSCCPFQKPCQMWPQEPQMIELRQIESAA